jgi:hypothetical protein
MILRAMIVVWLTRRKEGGMFDLCEWNHEVMYGWVSKGCYVCVVFVWRFSVCDAQCWMRP